MLEYIKEEANKAYTENGAACYSTTGSFCLDLFASVGSVRTASEKDIIDRFIRAYAEDKDLAMKILFYARDVRGGLGERRVFRTILVWLANSEPEAVKKNIEYIAEFGRYDDLLSLLGTECEAMAISVIKAQFEKDMYSAEENGSVSLLAKWMPSINASNKNTIKNAVILARALGLTNEEYRKALSLLRSKIGLLENNLRERDYSFDYEKQPSRAMFKYRAAFFRNDKIRYADYLNRVERGEAKLNTDNVSPYELVAPYLTRYVMRGNSFMRDISKEEKAALNATWNALPDFGGEENALAVIDTSGSMYGWDNAKPAAVALSLGLYFAERNKGKFANHFIEFSARPQLIEIKGKTFADRLRYAASFNKIANTNMQAVFDLILKAAVKNSVPQKELPAKLIIISDMEFDQCMDNADQTVFENAKKEYEKYGYRLPQVVFWNVASRNANQPVKKNDQGVILVSGATPRIFSMVAGNNMSPYTFMLEVLESERYEKIAA